MRLQRCPRFLDILAFRATLRGVWHRGAPRMREPSDRVTVSLEQAVTSNIIQDGALLRLLVREGAIDEESLLKDSVIIGFAGELTQRSRRA